MRPANCSVYNQSNCILNASVVHQTSVQMFAYSVVGDRTNRAHIS